MVEDAYDKRDCQLRFPFTTLQIYIYSYLMDYTVTTLWTMHFKTVKHQLARIINYTSMPEIMLPHNWPRGNGNNTKLDAELL